MSKYKDEWGIPLTLGDEIMDDGGWIYEIMKVKNRYIGKRIACGCPGCQGGPIGLNQNISIRLQKF